MNAKALLIPIAAFAVTVTGVSAFNSEVLENAGLNNDQISAFEEAYVLRKEGDAEGARDVLVEAGIDQEIIEGVREAHREYRKTHREAIHEAVANKDYNAFKDAIKDSPLDDIIQTKDDFELFVKAHALKKEKEYKEAREIFDELGIEKRPHRDHAGRGFGHRQNNN